MGCASNENSEYGESVGYFTKSKVSLESAEKQAGKLGGEYRDGCALALSYARDVIEGSLTSAVKDNEFIYHPIKCLKWLTFPFSKICHPLLFECRRRMCISN